MADGYRNSAGTDASALYDPDIVGDGYNATFLKRTDGSTLKYALAAYGTPGSNLGCRDSGGADVGPKWAAIGTAHYSLPFDGATYTESYTIPSASTGYSQLNFQLTSTTNWRIYGNNPSVPTNLLLSGTVPTGAVSCKATFGAVTTPSGYTSAGGTPSTNMAAATALATGLYAQFLSGTAGASSGSRQSSVPVTITFYNASSVAISTSTCTFIVDTEGSV